MFERNGVDSNLGTDDCFDLMHRFDRTTGIRDDGVAAESVVPFPGVPLSAEDLDGLSVVDAGYIVRSEGRMLRKGSGKREDVNAGTIGAQTHGRAIQSVLLASAGTIEAAAFSDEGEGEGEGQDY